MDSENMSVRKRVDLLVDATKKEQGLIKKYAGEVSKVCIQNTKSMDVECAGLEVEEKRLEAELEKTVLSYAKQVNKRKDI